MSKRKLVLNDTEVEREHKRAKVLYEHFFCICAGFENHVMGGSVNFVFLGRV